jgi:hypothetical protein
MTYNTKNNNNNKNILFDKTNIFNKTKTMKHYFKMFEHIKKSLNEPNNIILDTARIIFFNAFTQLYKSTHDYTPKSEKLTNSIVSIKSFAAILPYTLICPKVVFSTDTYMVTAMYFFFISFLYAIATTNLLPIRLPMFNSPQFLIKTIHVTCDMESFWVYCKSVRSADCQQNCPIYWISGPIYWIVCTSKRNFFSHFVSAMGFSNYLVFHCKEIVVQKCFRDSQVCRAVPSGTVIFCGV